MALTTAAAARHAAASILSESRFHGSSVPNPLHGFLVTVGRAIADPLGQLGSLFGQLGGSLPGGLPALWVLVAIAFLVVAGLLARRHAATLHRRARGQAGPPPPTAAELERAAEQAEREGRWSEAVRLRFRAGLLRLAERGDVRYAETTPNRLLAARLGSESLADLGDRFDQIVYGGATATAQDAERQREAWPKVIEESGRR